METKERNVGEYARPEGVEVKVSTGRITGIFFFVNVYSRDCECFII